MASRPGEESRGELGGLRLASPATTPPQRRSDRPGGRRPAIPGVRRGAAATTATNAVEFVGSGR